MKSSLLVTLIVLLTTTAQAQVVPKSRTIGGNISAIYRSREVSNTDQQLLSLGISPQFGKFTSDKWLMESNLIYSFSNVKWSSTSSPIASYTTKSSLVGVGGRFTRLFPITENFYFTTGAFVTAGTIFNSYQESSFQVIRSQDLNLTGGISPGLLYFISPRWILTGQFGAFQYQYITELDGNASSHYLGFQFSSNLGFIGIRYVLDPKKK